LVGDHGQDRANLDVGRRVLAVDDCTQAADALGFDALEGV
jgi:hypothetical protein